VRAQPWVDAVHAALVAHEVPSVPGRATDPQRDLRRFSPDVQRAAPTAPRAAL